MSSDAIYYVYAYLDPDTREPFYIGKGKNGRALAHLKEARDERITTKDYYNPIKLSRIRKILEQGMEPIIDYVCEEMTEEDALELEMFLIQEIGRIVLNEGPLTNLTDGGEGFSGLIQDRNVYHIVHVATGEERHATQYEMHRDLGISQAGACYLVSGKINVSKGWRLASNKDVKSVYIGQKHKFVNGYTGEEVYCTQNDLVKRYDLDSPSLSMVISGKRPHTEGWCLGVVPEYLKEKISFDTEVRSFSHHEKGVEHLNLNDMAAKHNINKGKLREVINGTRRHTQGWFLGEEVPSEVKGFKIGGGDPTIFNFINVENGETFTGTRVEFSSYTGIGQKTVWVIVRKGRTRRGWKLNE